VLLYIFPYHIAYSFSSSIISNMKFLILSLLVCHVLAIWPAPQSMTTGKSVVWIQKGFKVTYNGTAVRFSDEFPNHASDYVFCEHDTKFSFLQQLVVKRATVFTSQAVVQAAVQRAQNIIFAEKFVPWKFHKRNTLSKFEPVASGAAKTFITSLAITQTGTDTAKTFKPLAGEVDESYTLTLSAAGVATIKAVSSTGVLRALDTFTQLFYTHSQAGAGIYTNLAPLTIKDAPKFAHRGLNLDVSRNWYPKANILRTIDAISWNKFNRLHLHMTDSQSWPMYIPALPELSTLGAYQTGLVYSSADIAEIQTYAVYRGVEVIIEFDMPGHTTSIGYSHPELITGFDAKPWDKYCAEPPCGALKLNSPAVSTFLNTLLGDVLPRVSPYSSYFHTGGDEVNKQVYTLDPTVKSNSTAVLTPLLQKFVDRNHAQVRKAGLAPIVWEEMLLDWKLKLGTDVVVQTWISDEALGQVTAAGHKAIFGNYNYWVSLPLFLPPIITIASS
jgi:hexosaminidase